MAYFKQSSLWLRVTMLLICLAFTLHLYAMDTPGWSQLNRMCISSNGSVQTDGAIVSTAPALGSSYSFSNLTIFFPNGSIFNAFNDTNTTTGTVNVYRPSTCGQFSVCKDLSRYDGNGCGSGLITAVQALEIIGFICILTAVFLVLAVVHIEELRGNKCLLIWIFIFTLIAAVTIIAGIIIFEGGICSTPFASALGILAGICALVAAIFCLVAICQHGCCTNLCGEWDGCCGGICGDACLGKCCGKGTAKKGSAKANGGNAHIDLRKNESKKKNDSSCFKRKGKGKVSGQVSHPNAKVSHQSVTINNPDYRANQPDYRGTYPSVSVNQPDYRVSHPSVGVNQPDYRGTYPSVNATHPDYRVPNPSINVTHPDYRVTQPAVTVTHPDYKVTHPPVTVTHPDYKVTNPSVTVTHPDYKVTHPTVTHPDYKVTHPTAPYPDVKVNSKPPAGNINIHHESPRLAVQSDERYDGRVNLPREGSAKGVRSSVTVRAPSPGLTGRHREPSFVMDGGARENSGVSLKTPAVSGGVSGGESGGASAGSAKKSDGEVHVTVPKIKLPSASFNVD